jgi:hypothetical protein
MAAAAKPAEAGARRGTYNGHFDRWYYILRGDAEGRFKGKRPSVSPREGVTSANGGDTDAALGNPARCAWNKE